MGSNNTHSDIFRVLGGIGLNGQILATFCGQVAEITIGSISLFVGLATCGIAGIRRRSGTRILAWLGIWSAIYGAMQLTQAQAVEAASARLQICAPYANTAMMCPLVVVALLSSLELSLGNATTPMDGYTQGSQVVVGFKRRSFPLGKHELIAAPKEDWQSPQQITWATWHVDGGQL